MRLILLVCALFLFAGCGKKGALYLPDVPPTQALQSTEAGGS